MGTHPEIKDPDLRAILASERLTLRRLRKSRGIDLKDVFYFGMMSGFETALRRVQYERNKGITP